MRLVDGYSDSNGRFEICVNEKWGTVCDDKFGREEADATCGALGFKNSGRQPSIVCMWILHSSLKLTVS